MPERTFTSRLTLFNRRCKFTRMYGFTPLGEVVGAPSGDFVSLWLKAPYVYLIFNAKSLVKIGYRI